MHRGGVMHRGLLTGVLGYDGVLSGIPGGNQGVRWGVQRGPWSREVRVYLAGNQGGAEPSVITIPRRPRPACLVTIIHLLINGHSSYRDHLSLTLEDLYREFNHLYL